MLAAAVFLVGMFFFPLWKITLLAPQYPAGMSMFIWVSDIKGSDPGTLQNINILNHYIGMKPIEPNSIPELQFMKYFIVALSGLALVAALLNKWQGNLVWLILLVGAGILAVFDFYLWEYDYGHNLNPEAAIKISDMAYQPPLFGKKQILNFTAISYPRLGTLCMFLSMLSGAVALFFGLKKRKLNV